MIKNIYRKAVYKPIKTLLNAIETIRTKSLIVRSKSKLKVIIGSGGDKYVGWIATDINTLDITKKQDWDALFAKKDISKILAEHVFEHLTAKQAEKALKYAYAHLGKGGNFRIAVPDEYHPSKYVYDLAKPNGLDVGSDDHKIFWNYKKLCNLATSIGYSVKLVEYFDEHGIFHKSEDQVENGYIARSARNYRGRFTTSADEYQHMLRTVPDRLRKQFLDTGMSYTSLIVDCRKNI